jgi:hypothetical protein
LQIAKGARPPPVARLLRLAELRIQATAHGVGRIEVREGCVRIFRGLSVAERIGSASPLLSINFLPVHGRRGSSRWFDALFLSHWIAPVVNITGYVQEIGNEAEWEIWDSEKPPTY